MNENGCIHLDEFKSKNGLQSYSTIYSFFVASSTSEARRMKAKCCYCYVCKTFETRLHSCLTCIFFGCHKRNHIQEHSKVEKHNLAMELSYGNVMCFMCGDYVYDLELMRIAEEHQNKSVVMLGMTSIFRHWWPSLEDVELLKKNPCRRRVIKNTTIGLRGLVNLGNTCYVNCIIQVLTHIPLLRDFFLAERHECKLNETPETCFVCEISRIFQEFYSGDKSPLVLKHLLVLVWTQIEHMACDKQQDAHEFLMVMLDFLHKQSISMQTPHITTSPNHCSCIIDLIFTGKLQSDVICHVCNGVSTTIDPFWDISLELDSNGGAAPEIVLKSNSKNSDEQSVSSMLSQTDSPSQNSTSSTTSSGSSSSGGGKNSSSAKNGNGNGNGSGPLSLVECLEQFTRAEYLKKFKCNNCDAYQQTTKQLTLQKLPVVACFHLKRFKKVCGDMFAKISKIITFPLELDMTPFMSHRRNGNNTDSSYRNCCTEILEDNRYSLFAVVNHQGNENGGHYTAFIRQQYDEWFKCDDSNVTRANIADILNSEGYLLFYHKQILEYE